MDQQDIILAETEVRIKSLLGLDARQKVATPFAVIVGKSDTWLHLLGEKSIESPVRAGRLDVSIVAQKLGPRSWVAARDLSRDRRQRRSGIVRGDVFCSESARLLARPIYRLTRSEVYPRPDPLRLNRRNLWKSRRSGYCRGWRQEHGTSHGTGITRWPGNGSFYTSAPRSLEAGRSGFGTVASAPGHQPDYSWLPSNVPASSRDCPEWTPAG